MALNHSARSFLSSLSPKSKYSLRAIFLLLIASTTLAVSACAPETDDVDTPAEQQELDQGTIEEDAVPEEGMTNEGMTDEGVGTEEAGE